MSKHSKFSGERPIAINRHGIPVFRPSPRHAIARSLRQSTDRVERAIAENDDNINSGGIR
jgi:hypothetical protein